MQRASIGAHADTATCNCTPFNALFSPVLPPLRRTADYRCWRFNNRARIRRVLRFGGQLHDAAEARAQQGRPARGVVVHVRHIRDGGHHISVGVLAELQFGAAGRHHATAAGHRQYVPVVSLGHR